jgi:uncharacterized protein YceH (UPF0502 family)
MESQQTLPLLNAIELRVLGSLIEKSKTTPDYYPMTLNSLTAACNQKTSRNPVVNYSEEEIAIALNTLKKRGFTGTATGGTSRSIKHIHTITNVFTLTTAELVVLCLLFLRGHQTPGEINTNSGRMYEFDSIAEVLETLDKMVHTEPPYIQLLPKRAGQKEGRYTHLFAEVVDFNEEEQHTESSAKNTNELEARLTIVEQELAEVKESLNKLLKELLG